MPQPGAPVRVQVGALPRAGGVLVGIEELRARKGRGLRKPVDRRAGVGEPKDHAEHDEGPLQRPNRKRPPHSRRTPVILPR